MIPSLSNNSRVAIRNLFGKCIQPSPHGSHPHLLVPNGSTSGCTVSSSLALKGASTSLCLWSDYIDQAWDGINSHDCHSHSHSSSNYSTTNNYNHKLCGDYSSNYYNGMPNNTFTHSNSHINTNFISNRYFTTTTSSTSTKIEVTNTTNSTNNSSTNTNDSETNKSSSPPPSQKQKSHQQQSEEEIYELTTYMKTHYQHANYTEALSSAQSILEKSITLFATTTTATSTTDTTSTNNIDTNPTPNCKYNHPAIASAYNNLGLIHKMMGQYDLSKEYYATSLDIYQRTVGEDHASYAAILHNIASLNRIQVMNPLMDDDDTDNNNNDSNTNTNESNNSTNDSNQNMTASMINKLKLNQEAINLFQKAYNIRQVELGLEHVQTISSLSNLGAAIASQVLFQEQLEKFEKKSSTHVPSSSFSSSSSSSSSLMELTTQNWDIAEDYLRKAFRTSIQNPRGEQIKSQRTIVKNTNTTTSSQSQSQEQPLSRRVNSDETSTKGSSKKEKKKHAKEFKKILKQQQQQQKSQDNSQTQSWLGSGLTSIQTLSAAAAAQNLAVFLKSRADQLSSSSSTSNKSSNNNTHNHDPMDMYAESKQLYLGALHVRQELKGNHHPDTIATKFSLAELIHVLGDEDGANVLREEILGVYDITERDYGDVEKKDER